MPIYEYKCESCGFINTRICSVGDYTEDWEQHCCNCDSDNLRRVYYGVNIKWSCFGVGVTHRYRDPKLEKGLEYEKEKFGEPLTDAAAKKINEEQGL
jgi:putative FmdB family regulatory protein